MLSLLEVLIDTNHPYRMELYLILIWHPSIEAYLIVFFAAIAKINYEGYLQKKKANFFLKVRLITKRYIALNNAFQ